MRRILLYILLLGAITSCVEPIIDDPQDDGIVKFMLGTQGGTETATYRFLLFNSVGSYIASGTYRDVDFTSGATWLMPGEVNDSTGAWKQKNSKFGLQSPTGTFDMSIVSPAVAISDVSWDLNKKGFYQEREKQEGDLLLYFSPSIKGLRFSGTTVNDNYVYQVPSDYTLKERRSSIQITLKCGDKIDQANLSDVKLSNIIDKGYYQPQEEYMLFEDSCVKDIPLLTESITLYKDEDLNNGQLKTKVLSQTHIFAQDYTIHKPYPQLLLKVGGSAVKIDFALNFKPQHHYSYTITVNSTSVVVEVHIEDWSSINNGGSIDKQPDIAFTVEIDSWQSGGDTGVID